MGLERYMLYEETERTSRADELLILSMAMSENVHIS